MAQYLARKLLQSVFLLVLLSMVLFALVNSVPGGLMTAYENNPDITAEDYARLQEKYGLNDPLPTKYVKWVTNLVRGDWGNSFISKRPVSQEILERLPNTLLLMGTAFIVTLLIGIPLGVYSSLHKYSSFDHVATTLAFAGQSLPVFWFGLLLIIVFSVKLGWFPGSGMTTPGQPFSFWDLARHMVLPVTMLSLVSAASYMRFTRSSMLDVTGQDYVRTARAKGLSEGVVTNHALRNALIPVVTLVMLDLPTLFGGAIFTETMFAWPGMGRLFVDSAFKTDWPVLMALLVINAALIILANLTADVLYAWLDPRIRFS
ncbi:MAG: ABC transporter permease [Caldilineaceae bacterium]